MSRPGFSTEGGARHSVRAGLDARTLGTARAERHALPFTLSHFLGNNPFPKPGTL